MEKASGVRCKAKRCFHLTLTRVFQICRSLTVTQEEARVIKSSTGTSYRHFSFTTALSRSQSAAFHTLFLQPTKKQPSRQQQPQSKFRHKGEKIGGLWSVRHTWDYVKQLRYGESGLRVGTHSAWRKVPQFCSHVWLLSCMGPP